jgi:hypothetical protein
MFLTLIVRERTPDKAIFLFLKYNDHPRPRAGAGLAQGG